MDIRLKMGPRGKGSPTSPKHGISLKSQKSDSFGTNPTFAWDFFWAFRFSLLDKSRVHSTTGDYNFIFKKKEESWFT